MFDQRHYVPILKTKAGEAWALQNLDFKVRVQMTPVLEIHRPPKKNDKPPTPMKEHIHEVCASIKDVWGPNPFFLDTEWVNTQHGTAAALTIALEACRVRRLKAIPVVKIGHDELALNVVKSAAENDKRGYMLRLDFEDASAQAAIRGVVDYLGLNKGDLHLLLDYRQQSMNLNEDVPKLPSLKEWMTFTAASAAFPKTISTLPPRTWNEVPRHDWNAWEKSVMEDDLSRKPTFSDYATRCAGPPTSGGDPRVHLRYTKDKNWLVYLDGTLQSGDAPKMRSICRKLIAKPEYDGLGFSKGDSEINRIAHQEKETGAATQWVQWCVNHHLTYVARRIQENSDF